MITDRVPFGILEMKSAWVTDDPDSKGSVIRALARSGFHAMFLLDLQFCMATSAPHVLDRGARQEAWWRPYPRRRIPTSATGQG